MKYLPGLIFLFGLFSCNDADHVPPASSSPRPKLLPKDSNAVSSELANPYVAVDVSPMDIAWLPVDYPKLSSRKPTPVARVLYGRPHKQGRKIFGNLVKYGERWRLGANEATEIELFIPVTIQNKTVAKGRYILYCIPQENNWTIVFNKNIYSWGLNLDPSEDVARFTIPATEKNQSVEYFSMIFQTISGGAELLMAWDNMEARLPIQYKE